MSADLDDHRADGDPQRPGDVPSGELADLTYADAIDELEGLVDDLERDDADVDELAAKVRRASALIGLCRSRIGAARIEIDRIVTDLEA